jgi:hypothetical protein
MKSLNPATRRRRAVAMLATGTLLALGATTAAAADRLAPLLACRALADAAARLACFDRESAALAPVAAKPELSPEQKFGLDPRVLAAKEAEQGQPRADVDAVDAKLSALRAGADGRYVFTLDNGQAWRQLQPGSDLLLKAGDAVRITRGALGSFLLTAPGQRSCKVTRVR